MMTILKKRRESALAWNDCERAFLNWSRCRCPETETTLEASMAYAWDTRRELEAAVDPSILPDQGRRVVVYTATGDEEGARYLFEDELTGRAYVVVHDAVDGDHYVMSGNQWDEC